MTSTTQRHHQVDTFRHEAVFYAGDGGFVRALTPFLQAGVAAKQPVFVVVPGRKIDLLRDALGKDARQVEFADMADVGRNPARIIPAWTEFVQRNADSPGLWGVGEPIDAKRSPDELIECQRHEALLNLAFEGGPPLRLACPYDTVGLDGDVIEEAKRSHPFVGEGVDTQLNLEYIDRGPAAAGFDEPLPATLWLAGIFLLVWVPFKRSRLGIATYAVGSDRAAAFLSGLNVGRTRIAAIGQHPTRGTATQRLAGYREAIAEAGGTATAVHLDNTLEDYRREIQRRVFG